MTSPEVRAVIWDERLKASMSALWDGQQFRPMTFDDYFEHVPLSWTDEIAFLEPADLIIHETNLGPAHTPYAALAALPAELRARMRLIHYADGFDTATSTITALREGEVLHP